jgi:glycosyltransferase involved in cell wall biosynthesis
VAKIAGMNALFLNVAFPDLEAGANLYGDLATEFAARGHSMHVATLLERKHGRESRLETQRGVQVLRVASGNLFNVGFVRKGLTMLALERDFRKAIRRAWPGVRFDLVLYPTPPITFVRLIEEQKREQGAATYLILRDIFPQNAVDVGIMGRGVVYRYFRRVERRLYAASDRIGCMSPANVEWVSRDGVPREKLELLPNWRRIREPPPGGRDLRKEWGLEGKFVAVFGGVLGIAQELDFLLELAHDIRDRKDIAFVVVGEGNRKAHLRATAERLRLDNVLFRDRLTPGDFARLLRQADAGLVNLNRRFTIPNFPSKVLDYFEAGLPVLASLDGATDFGKMIDESGGGLWSVTGDLPGYRKNLERMAGDAGLRKEMGRRGRSYLEQNFTVERAYGTIVR